MASLDHYFLLWGLMLGAMLACAPYSGPPLPPLDAGRDDASPLDAGSVNAMTMTYDSSDDGWRPEHGGSDVVCGCPPGKPRAPR